MDVGKINLDQILTDESSRSRIGKMQEATVKRQALLTLKKKENESRKQQAQNKQKELEKDRWYWVEEKQKH